MLYYLNNHRGGFFRFFNGGAAYGDGDNAGVGNAQYNTNSQNYNQGFNYNQAPNYNQQLDYNQQNNQYQAQQQQLEGSTATNLAFLTGLADAINQGGGINLSNLGANSGVLGNLASLVGGMAAGGGLGGGVSNLASLLGGQSGAIPGAGSNFNVGDIFSNLLTGFVGNRFSSRRISKRSVDMEPVANVSSVTEPLLTVDKELKYVKETDVKKRNLNTEMKSEFDNKEVTVDEKEEIFAEDEDEEDEYIESVNEEPEGRIVNLKEPIIANDLSNNVIFPTNIINPLNKRVAKRVKFTDANKGNTNAQTGDIFVFQTNYDSSNDNINEIVKFPQKIIEVEPTRNSKKIKFASDQSSQGPVLIDPNDRRIKMVFPDRTGTGNLRFDIEEFDQATQAPIRYGRILTGQQPSHSQTNGDRNRVNFSNGYDSSSFDVNNYQNNNNQYQQSTAASPNRYSIANYQTNRFENQNYDYNSQSNNNNNNYQGQTAQNNNYNTNQQGSDQNVYVTNSKGVVEYYINSAGRKVYL